MVCQISGQVEVRMVGHVDDRRRVRRGGVPDVDRVVLSEGEGHVGGHSAGEVRVTVRRDNLQLQMRGVRLQHIVDLVLPAVRASVQAMAEIILRQLILNAVQRKPSAVDAVGVTPDGSPEIRLVVLREIVRDLVEAKDDILELTVPVRHHHGHDPATKIGDAHLHTRLVGQCVEGSPRTVTLSLEVLRIQPRLCE